MDSLSNTGKMPSSSLFPAYNSASVNDNVATPLFPAYVSQIQTAESKNDGKDWLCNSSYSPSHNEEIYVKQEDVSEIKVKEKEKIKPSKKSKKEKLKKKPIPHPSIYDVPDDDSIRNFLNKKTFIEETGLSFERAYRVDSKCDPENMHFECLEQKNIAKYKLYPKIPIGLSSGLKELWPKPSAPVSKDVFPRYFSKKAIKLLKKEQIDFDYKEVKKCNVENVSLNFIPLSETDKKCLPIQDLTKEGYEGISISWKSQLTKKTESEDKIIEKTAADIDFRNRTISFNKQLSESPQNIQLWLEFVDFQDELYLSENRENLSIPHSEASVLEKKVAILDKALSHNPKSVSLNVTKLNLCRGLWKLDKLISSWDELIFLNPNNTDVWQEYFIFVLTNLTYFTTPRILKLYSKCLRILSNLSEGIIQSHKAPPDIIPKMINIFSQMCFILKSCGYMEKAVGTFQALIEFNLFNESAIESLPVSDQILFLEPFWESSAARFGENGAIGWESTVSEKKIAFDKLVTQSDLSNYEDKILNEKLSECETWLQFEKLRKLHNWLPWKPNPDYDQTDEDIDDIDRTVSFDDVSKYLFRVSEDEHKFLLIVKLLNFLGFNPHFFGCNISNQNIKETYIDIENYEIVSQTLKNTLFNEISSPLCFNEDLWTKDRTDFINNIFSQALSRFSPKFKILLSLMWLRFYQKFSVHNSNSMNKIGESKKFAKSMLKEVENRNCLLLWFEFIKIELNSSLKKAKKTFETLLASSCDAVVNKNMAADEMWYFIRSGIDLSLRIQDYSGSNTELLSKDEIISLLASISSKKTFQDFSTSFVNPTCVLRSVSGFKSFLEQELQKMVTENFILCPCINPSLYSALDCAKCYAYFQYFTQGIDAALCVFKDVLKYIEDNLHESNKSYILEKVHVLQADLLNFHTWNSTASIKPFQSFLKTSLSKYPNSSILLYYLIKLKSACCVVSSTRRFFAKLLKRSNKLTPETWVFVFASELAILNYLANQNASIESHETFVDVPFCEGIKWKIRSLYEKVLNSPMYSPIPIMWRSYMKFEISNNEKDKAKSIFHRGMQSVSWSKDLLMDGIEYFHDDLKQILDFMTEKQMRIYTPLEEIKLLMEHCVEED